MVSFTVEGVPQGQPIDVELIAPGDLTSHTWYKYRFGPNWYSFAFDGTTGLPLPGTRGGFTVPAPASRSPGATVGCADLSGDGVPDILVGLPAGPGGGSQVLSFNGADGSPLGQVPAFPGLGGEVFVAP